MTVTPTTTTITSPASPAQDQAITTTTTTMDQDLLQFFDSLSQPSPMGDWFTAGVTQQQQQDVSPLLVNSTYSSPEIATPLDIPLSSPSTAVSKIDPVPTFNFGATIGVGGDLNSPLLFDTTPTMTPATPHIDMFSDLSQDLPSVLAAFVTAVSTGTTSSTTSSTYQQQQSITPSSTPTTGQKRSTNDETTPDEVTLKRQKNTDAARRSRLKKVMKMEALEKRVQELERMNAQLLLRVAVLDSEKTHLKTKESTHEARIKSLESQLADAHKALSSRST
ncbi:hypothetical protein BC941DRAFT_412503 [Chlamydoabsidia padenii]|nr:hypothetical protein BC941DRAFT_412503 [Chlamydoabsidia padenii]